jgi:hypothetical protein
VTTRNVLTPVFAILLLAVGLLAAPTAFADTFVVNATDDTATFSEIGPCTSTHCNLRQAITAANAASVCSIVTFTCTQQVINFNLPRSLISIFNGQFFFGPPAPIKINPELTSLTVKGRLFIDGTTQPGYVSSPTVVLQGEGNVGTTGPDGLDLVGFGGSTIRGLGFQNFKHGSAILIESDNNTIIQNYIGTDGSSTMVGNSDGIILLQGINNKIGEPTVGNLISGNGTGVFLNGGGSTLIQGNLIGTNPAGNAALPNTQDGILIRAGFDASSLIGGLGTSEGNVIAFNGGAGINYTLFQLQHQGQAIRANSIFSNAGLGIDQRNLEGVLQPAPTLTATSTGFTTVPSGLFVKIVPTTTISGSVKGKANSTVSLDFFDNDVCDPIQGEGQTYIGTRSVSTDASGNASFQVQFNTTFALATATATSATNDTSAFSNCKFVSSPSASGTPRLTPVDATVSVHQNFTYTFKWTVPPPATWHTLTSLQLRLRNDDGVALQLRWDAATNTFSVFDLAAGKFGPAFAPGSNNVLETADATVFLKDTSVVGSGPTAPTVTLTLSLGFKPGAASNTFVAEVAASDAVGHVDAFAPVGTLSVSR